MNYRKAALWGFGVWLLMFSVWMVIGVLFVVPPRSDAEKTKHIAVLEAAQSQYQVEVTDLGRRLRDSEEARLQAVEVRKEQSAPSVQQNTNAPNSMNLIQGDDSHFTIKAENVPWRVSAKEKQKILDVLAKGPTGSVTVHSPISNPKAEQFKIDLVETIKAAGWVVDDDGWYADEVLKSGVLHGLLIVTTRPEDLDAKVMLTALSKSGIKTQSDTDKSDSKTKIMIYVGGEP